MTEEQQYKKALVNFLYYQALHKRKSELQNVLFFEEETTDNWTLEQCQVQYVKDQLKYIEDGNFDEEIIETWNLVFNEQGEQQIINKTKAWLQEELSEVIKNPLYEDDDSRESALLEGRYECAEGLLGQIKTWEK
jgi:aminoglycoside phosphotransferase family enzyme